MPYKNEKDIEEIPSHMKDSLKFHFVKKMDDVIRLALTSSRKKAG